MHVVDRKNMAKAIQESYKIHKYDPVLSSLAFWTKAFLRCHTTHTKHPALPTTTTTSSSGLILQESQSFSLLSGLACQPPVQPPKFCCFPGWFSDFCFLSNGSQTDQRINQIPSKNKRSLFGGAFWPPQLLEMFVQRVFHDFPLLRSSTASNWS